MRMAGTLLVLGACVGCLEERAAVHLSLDLQNCQDSVFNTVCVAEGIAEDSPSHDFIHSTFEMTLSGNIVLDGKDTAVSRYKVAVTLDPGGFDSLLIPADIGKRGPPLVVKACLRDEADVIACDSLTYSEL